MTEPTDDAVRDFTRRFPTVDAYVAHHQRAGHICCYCPNVAPPMPCCNPGHDAARRIEAEFNEVLGEH